MVTQPDVLGALRRLEEREAERRAADPAGYEAERVRYEAERRESEEQDAMRRRTERLDRSGILAEVPDELRMLLITDRLPETEPVRVVREWLASSSRRPVLVLGGTTGVGKTIAAGVGLAAESGMFKSADEIVAITAAMFGPEAEERERCLRSRMLVIDDVGTEQDVARMTAALVLFLSKRASAMWTPTILTMNMSAQAFRKRYDSERLMSRFSKAAQWASLKETSDLRRKPLK